MIRARLSYYFAPHQQFWFEHPALLLGISFLIGIGISLYSFPLYLAVPWIFYCAALKKWTSIGAIFIAALYAWLLYGSMPILSGPIPCEAHLSIHSVQPHQSPFHRDLQMRGSLRYNGAMLPCTLFVQPTHRPDANSDYWISGQLQQRGPYEYIFKLKEWKPIPHTWSLAELRFKAKENFRHFLKTKLAHKKCATLLSSLATGDVDDRLLRYEFSRLGLQHILAISGFHFGIILAFFSFLLGLFLPARFKWIALLLATTCYYLFIGASPAVQRAWITASLFVISKLINRPASSINLLGAALLIELLLNPLVASSIGFQLSFGCCIGLLLLYPPILAALSPLFPSRAIAKSQKLPPASQWIYLLSSTFRSSIALTLAVNTAILPLLLYHFGKFPYLSLLYNLFFPLLITLALTLLLLALLIHLLVPPFATPLFTLLDTLTHNLLQLTSHPPLPLDYSLYFQNFPIQSVPLYLFAILFITLRPKRTYIV